MNNLRTTITWESAVRLSLLAAGIGAAACLWWAWCHFPQLAWNEVRLAPAFALRHGINPYPLVGGGPLSTWIYGPIGMVVNLPATYAQSATDALRIASLVNFLLVLGPLALVIFGAPELRARGLVLCGLALALGILLVPAPNLVLQVADHAAIAFGLLSCWCLSREAPLPHRSLAWAAALCTLAVWSKQTAVFLFAGQLAYLLLAGDRRGMARAYTGWVVGLNALLAGAAVLMFGFDNLWLNLVTIPSRLPWADILARLSLRPLALFAQVVLPSLGLLLLWRLRRWPPATSASGRFFQVTAAVYCSMLPIGLAAYCKIGGDTNLLHSWCYLMPGGLLVWLAGGHPWSATSRSLLVVTAGALALHWPRLIALPAQAQTRHLEMADRITAAFPNAVWFPQNPVITYYAGGRLWHTEDGIVTRQLAGCGLRGPDFRPFLPPHLKAVVYPVFSPVHAVMPLLPEFNQTTELPYWILLTPAQPEPRPGE